MAPPATMRENRSSTTARYSRPLPFHAGRHGLAVVFVAYLVKVKGQAHRPATSLAGLKGPGRSDLLG